MKFCFLFIFIVIGCSIYSNDEIEPDTLNADQKTAVSNIFKANGINVTYIQHYTNDSSGMVKTLTFPTFLKLDTLIITNDIKALTELEVLNIPNQNFSSLPQELTQIPKLKELSLSGNSFFEYPDVLWSLPQLFYVDLSHNFLRLIPSEISKLMELNSLAVNNNQIDSISPEFTKLKKLKWLNISNNNLSSLPDSIIGLSLESLFIHGNKLCNISDTLQNWLMLDSQWHQQSC